LGSNFKIMSSLWGSFSLAFIHHSNGMVSLNPGFNLGLGTPEKVLK